MIGLGRQGRPRLRTKAILLDRDRGNDAGMSRSVPRADRTCTAAESHRSPRLPLADLGYKPFLTRGPSGSFAFASISYDFSPKTMEPNLAQGRSRPRPCPSPVAFLHHPWRTGHGDKDGLANAPWVLDRRAQHQQREVQTPAFIKTCPARSELTFPSK